MPPAGLMHVAMLSKPRRMHRDSLGISYDSTQAMSTQYRAPIVLVAFGKYLKVDRVAMKLKFKSLLARLFAPTPRIHVEQLCSALRTYYILPSEPIIFCPQNQLYRTLRNRLSIAPCPQNPLISCAVPSKPMYMLHRATRAHRLIMP